MPKAVILCNMIPRAYVDFDLYCNLIPDTANQGIFEQMPRTGAFEVSYKGILLFSKLQSGLWPAIEVVAEKCRMMCEAEQSHSNDITGLMAGRVPSGLGDSMKSKKSNKGPGTASSYQSSTHNLTQNKDQNSGLNSITRNDLGELKSLAKPPQVVISVLQAVAAVLDKPNKDWGQMKPMLAKPTQFIDQVSKCKAEKISGSKLSGLKKRVAKIDPEQAIKCSRACYGLAIWLQ